MVYQKKAKPKSRFPKKKQGQAKPVRVTPKNQVSLMPTEKYSLKGLQGYDASRSLEKQNATVKAKLIRQRLAEKFPGVDFRVKTKRYSMGESVDVYWTDGPALDKVEPLLTPFEDLNMDPSTGEILCGGNSHVFAQRTIRPETQTKIDDSVRAKYGQDLKDWDQVFQSQRWQVSRSTDFPNQPAPNWSKPKPNPEKNNDFRSMSTAEAVRLTRRLKK
jgi:hypothetical protein